MSIQTLGLSQLVTPAKPAATPTAAPRMQQVIQKRYWNAANVNRLTSDWSTSILSPNLELWTDLRKLRARSRALVRNNDHAAAFVKLVERNVIGPKGMQLQAKIKNLRGDGLRDPLNSLIEAEFDIWGRRKFCSADRKLAWLGFQLMVARTWVTDGEVIIWKKRVDTSVNPHGFQLQFIDADRLDYTIFNSFEPSTGNQIILGVEINPDGMPLAYHVFSKHPSEWSGVPTTRIRIPADEIIHLFIPHRAGAVRGIPWMAPAMLDLQMLGGYTEAELVAARTAAAKLGFITSEDDGAFAGEATPGSPDGGAGNPDGTLKMSGDSGTIEQLDPGQNFVPWDPQHPTTAFESFVKGVLRAIAAGLGVSYNSLANDLENVNFSSIRAGLLDERDGWRLLQALMKADFFDPVIEGWLGMEMLLGRIQLGSMTFEQAFMGMQWHGRSWPWVDPYKDAQANVLAVENAFDTRSRICAEKGYDFEELVAELAREQKIIKDAGIVVGTDTKGVADTATDDQSASDGSGDGSTEGEAAKPNGKAKQDPKPRALM